MAAAVREQQQPAEKESYFVYGKDSQYLQVSLQPGGAVIAQRCSLVACSKSVHCVPLPGAMTSGVEALLAAMSGHDARRHQLFVNGGTAAASAGFALACAGNIVTVDLADTGALLVVPDALVCASRDALLERQTRFGARSDHPCARLLRVSSATATGAAGGAGADAGGGAAANGAGAGGGGAGDGGGALVFLGAAGVAVQKVLQAGEAMLVAEGCLVAFSEGCQVMVPRRATQTVGPLNRGRARVIEVKGPGTLYVQSERWGLRRAAANGGGADLGGGGGGADPSRTAVLLVMLAMVVIMSWTLLELDTLDQP